MEQSPTQPFPALAGFLFMLISRPSARHEFFYAVGVAVVGTALYLIRARLRGEWPFRIESAK